MSNAEISTMPPYHAMFNPVLQALRDLGGSGSISEINEKASELIGVPQNLLDVLHNSEQGNTTEVEYRLGWARTYLKKFGLIQNSSRGIWTLTPKADAHIKVDPSEVVKFVQKATRENQGTEPVPFVPGAGPLEEVETSEEGHDWHGQLFRILTRQLSPVAFERLVQLVLRESGFIQVEVTGRSGDGGIDGKGIAQIHGILSFHVVFQCKRYQGVVGSPAIRDFRGATVGRADKGLFITTGTFSLDAKKEANRDGAPPIDLIDGNKLIIMLKELSLGVKVEEVKSERVTVDSTWFDGI